MIIKYIIGIIDFIYFLVGFYMSMKEEEFEKTFTIMILFTIPLLLSSFFLFFNL